MGNAFLVELGTEELPPGRLRGFARDFHDRIIHHLVACGLMDAATDSHWYCSPRRMAVVVAKVRDSEPNRVSQRLGPSVKAAFDTQGTPTKAAQGFARSCGVAVADLEQRDTDKGTRLAFDLAITGRTAGVVLAEAVTTAVANMSIPRRMRWGDTSLGFIRPLHWLVMLHGTRVVECELFGVRAGAKTRGHRFHHPARFEVSAPDNYVTDLHDIGHVEVDDVHGRLGKLVLKLATDAADGAGGKIRASVTLATEIAALVEWPVPISGSFDKAYLQLPEEVIEAVLEGQQRYFPVRNGAGVLQPAFVAISNIASKNPDAVRAGNEKVIRPRLEDALFFWKNDVATALGDRITTLEKVVFQAGLGSLADKAERMVAITALLAKTSGADAAVLGRAARLCKCDLATDMVGEFASLQGIMGGYYATATGESGAVASAIRDHYLPLHADEAIPATLNGQCLAIADKLDTIAGTFALGNKPSGTKDPFALRRAATGIVRIILEARLTVPLAPLIGVALDNLPLEIDARYALGSEIKAFIFERLRRYVVEQGVRVDIVNAVLALNLDEPVDITARITALSRFAKQPAAQALAAAHKRSANILRKAEHNTASEVNQAQLQDRAEMALYRAIESNRDALTDLVTRQRYEEALGRLAKLREPVDLFFERVMVMDDDLALRANRLALLHALHGLFGTTADWSQIQVEA